MYLIFTAANKVLENDPRYMTRLLFSRLLSAGIGLLKYRSSLS